MQQPQYTPLWKGQQAQQSPLQVKNGLIGGLIQSYLGGITGGAVGGGGAAAKAAAAGGQEIQAQQAAPVQQQPQWKDFGSSAADYATQQRPALGLLNAGYNSYNQGAQNGGGMAGGAQNIWQDVQGAGQGLVNQGQGYLNSLSSFF